MIDTEVDADRAHPPQIGHTRERKDDTRMARSLNKVQLIGNLGADPDVRMTTGGKKVAEFGLATSRSWIDNRGERRELTQWHRIIVWEGLAKIAESYLHKGSRVYIEGELQYRSYEDKEGKTRYVTEIIGREMVMLDGPRETAAVPQADGASEDAQEQMPFDTLPSDPQLAHASA